MGSAADNVAYPEHEVDLGAGPGGLTGAHILAVV